MIIAGDHYTVELAQKIEQILAVKGTEVANVGTWTRIKRLACKKSSRQ